MIDCKNKITHWNFFDNSKTCTGAGRYEYEIFKHLSELPNIDMQKTHIPHSIFNALYSDIKTYNANIIHATYQELAPLKLIKHPKNFVLTVLDIIPSSQFSIFKKLKRFWYLTEMSIQYADKIIAISEYTKHELVNRLGIDKDKITVVPLGVKYYYKPYDKQACRAIFNMDNDKKYILIVSSNAPWKNMKVANEIINRLHDEYQFIKIGYGEYLNNPYVINLGNVPEHRMPLLYNACDLFLHTSKYEGFGLPILEAMACGCPVISSNATALPEVVKDVGMLVPPDNVNLFVDMIDYILHNDDLYNTMKRRGINNASRFTWKRTAIETLAVYDTLV